MTASLVVETCRGVYCGAGFPASLVRRARPDTRFFPHQFCRSLTPRTSMTVGQRALQVVRSAACGWQALYLRAEPDGAEQVLAWPGSRCSVPFPRRATNAVSAKARERGFVFPRIRLPVLNHGSLNRRNLGSGTEVRPG